MEASADGRRAEFETLVIEHHVRVRAFVRSLGADPDWVDDIAQEAFLIAYREFEAFDASRDFGKWVRGIAANIVRNELRKDARRQRILHTELADLLLKRYAASAQQPEPVAIEVVRRCVEELTTRSRQVVRGRYHDGLAAPQLAERLGLSADNVRQMLVRVRRQIKQCVELKLKLEV